MLLFGDPYGNLLINGGFMGFQAALVSTYPTRIFHNQVTATKGILVNEIINPRNGLNARQNVIRYDYRLRAGGPGFETLKEFFAD
jgi:hypothetical protein